MEEITNYEAFGAQVLEKSCATYYARKKGRSHVENHTVCQDYCLVENLDESTQVVCVADGHGGEAYTKSDVGSRIACTVFFELVRIIKQNYKRIGLEGVWLNVLKTKDFKKSFIRQWRTAVLEDYKKTQDTISESEAGIIKKYGTTFLFAVYDESGLALGQLGDGAILLANEEKQSQLFKRHNLKKSSATSSLASTRAEYAFVIDVYHREQFSQVLLSTDGIYDKLDTEDAFLIYEQALVEQIKTEGGLNQPFHVQGMDISEISKDDCTIAILVTEHKTQAFEVKEMEKEGYEELLFQRSLNGVTVFSGKKDGAEVEIHVVDDATQECVLEMKACQCLRAKEAVVLSDKKTAYVYEVSKDWVRVSRLMECGEQLEKRYWFNDAEAVVNEDEILESSMYSNEYWLAIYEQMLAVEKEADEQDAFFLRYFLECMFLTGENKIVILSDAFAKAEEETQKKNTASYRFFDAFSIIGKLVCGKMAIPLFESYTQGQNIVMLHSISKKKPLCRVIFNKEKKILGLWNATNQVWNIENEKRKEIPMQGVLRLNKDHVFYIKSEEDKCAFEAELLDGYAKYQVVMLRK